jgi:competence protein ComGC
MKTKTCSRRGFSLLEVFVVVATVALFIIFIIPMLSYSSRPMTRSKRISCTSNLKQVGLTARIYANDHEDRFPWMVSTNSNPTNTSGSLELTNSPQVFVHFQAMSNELVTPKVLHCASDEARSKRQDFVGLSNKDVSYFVGFDAIETNPQSILSGDRNITGGIANGFLRLIPANTQLGWTKEIHQNAGNIGLGDGSVQQVNSQSLTRQRASITNAIIRLAIP